MADGVGFNRKLDGKQLAVTLLLGLFVVGGLSYIDAANPFKNFLKSADSVESAKELMIGTWTYTEPINLDADPFPVYWVKWEVKSDGTMTAWHAHPSDANWGEGDKLNYSIISDKYSSNGERWYGIADPDGFTTGVYEDGHIILHGASQSKAGRMKRGDINPFSK